VVGCVDCLEKVDILMIHKPKSIETESRVVEELVEPER